MTSFPPSLTNGYRSRKQHPCPICTEKKKGCKVTDTGLILCLRANRNTQILGYRYIKDLQDGLGCMFVPEDHEQSYTHNNQTKDQLRVPRPGISLPRLVWDHASCILQGRFPQKLTQAGIWDSSYCRYLGEEEKRQLENHVHQQWRNGVYSDGLILQSGLFRQNLGVLGYRWQLRIPVGRVLGIFDLQGKLMGIRSNPEVPVKVKVKGETTKLLKYLQPKGVPLHPYLPKVSRERLQKLWASQTPYLLVITEGEDTTESPAQNITHLGELPVVFVGLPGVDGWLGQDGKLHPQLHPIIQHCTHLV